jgi:hypothetical protein
MTHFFYKAQIPLQLDPHLHSMDCFNGTFTPLGALFSDKARTQLRDE